MSGVNKVIIIGRLGQDPELRYTTSGQPVARFSVATSESWVDKNTGNREERTEWHRIVAWGKLAELCRDYLRKGRQVYVDGRLQTRSWEDPSGQKRYTTEIIANNVVFLDRVEKTDSNVSVNAGANVNNTNGITQVDPSNFSEPMMDPTANGTLGDNVDTTTEVVADDDVPF